MAKKHPIAPVPFVVKGDPTLRPELRCIRAQLTNVYAVLVTVAHALERDQIEHNADYARCLIHAALEPLDEQIVQIEELSDRLCPLSS